MPTRRIVRSEAHAEVEEKGSRFRASCFPVADQEEALAILEKVARAERRATHLCFSMRVEESARSSDAGEPSGTAGRPIQAAIDEMGLDHVLVTVARTFGGVKLGAGGLKRAYHKAALAALRAARLEEPPAPRLRRAVTVPYARLPALVRLARRHGAALEEVAYGSEVRATLAVESPRAEALWRELAAIAREVPA